MRDEITLLTPTKSLGITNFWKSFRLFASPFEEFCLRYWYILFLGYSLVLVLLDLVLDLRHGIDLLYIFSHSGDHYYLQHRLMFSLAKSDATNFLLISEGLGLVLIAFTFRIWYQSITPLFQYFYNMGRICSAGSTDKVDQKEYTLFLEEYQQALLNRKRYIVFACLLVLVIGLMCLVILPRIMSIVSGLGSDGVYETLALIRWPGLLIIFCGTALAYYIASGGWIMAVTGWYIRKLTTRFHLIIQPRHLDNCGGLRQLGNFCLGMALPILIAALFLGTYGIVFALTKTDSGVLVLASNVFLFLVALPLAAIAFFVPLWCIHQRMVEQKQENEEDFSCRVTVLEKRIYSSLEEGEIDKAKAAKDELEVIQMLHPDDINYPLWPFDRRIFLVYLTPQLVPVISLLVGINSDGPVANALKAVLGFLSGHPGLIL